MPHRTHIIHFGKSVFWFSIGALLGLFFFISFLFILFQRKYDNKIYPGVTINGVQFGEKSQDEIKAFFARKNTRFADTTFTFQEKEVVATISAKQINLGYDENLLAQQAYSLGRSKDILSNMSLILQAYVTGVDLPPSYHYSEDELTKLLTPAKQTLHIQPVDAIFKFDKGRVITFLPSSEGQDLDLDALKRQLNSKIFGIVVAEKPQEIAIQIPIKVIKPDTTTDEANNLGIRELIGSGTSLFQGSIPNRVFNVTHAASKMNGVLVAPNETFSFDKVIGDISALTGYKQAYVIQNGKTVLGDGGGVCQVSTTLFRAVLNAGLPVVERHAHDYRVHYYEDDIGPGIDATVFYPTVDLKFKNDTGHSILIQTVVDETNLQLTFYLYGTRDGRQVTMSKPVITSQSPAPPDLYQDDPTLPKGVVKQVDFAAPGAKVYFTRQVERDGKILISEKFTSNYRPWQAIYLRGTQ